MEKETRLDEINILKEVMNKRKMKENNIKLVKKDLLYIDNNKKEERKNDYEV